MKNILVRHRLLCPGNNTQCHHVNKIHIHTYITYNYILQM